MLALKIIYKFVFSIKNEENLWINEDLLLFLKSMPWFQGGPYHEAFQNP